MNPLYSKFRIRNSMINECVAAYRRTRINIVIVCSLELGTTTPLSHYRICFTSRESYPSPATKWVTWDMCYLTDSWQWWYGKTYSIPQTPPWL